MAQSNHSPITSQRNTESYHNMYRTSAKSNSQPTHKALLSTTSWCVAKDVHSAISISILGYISLHGFGFTKTEPTLSFTWHFSPLIEGQLNFLLRVVVRESCIFTLFVFQLQDMNMCLVGFGLLLAFSTSWPIHSVSPDPCRSCVLSFVQLLQGLRDIFLQWNVFCTVTFRLDSRLILEESWALVKITCLLLKYTLCFDISDLFLAFLLYK